MRKFILFFIKALGTDALRDIIIKLAEELAERTDSNFDDKLVEVIKKWNT